MDPQGAELYRRFGPVIFARCRSLLKDETLAEAATVEVFLRVGKQRFSTASALEAVRLIQRESIEVWGEMLRGPAALRLHVSNA
jgi:hypothetical protein